MASVKANVPTSAREQLDFALGKQRVFLEQLSKKEFDEFLESTLRDLYLRDLRGFKSLKDLLNFTHGGPAYHTLDVQNLSLSDQVVFTTAGFKDDLEVSLETHTLNLSRRWFSWKCLFKRNESNEETKDYTEANLWGYSGYHHSGSAKVVAFRRPRHHHSYGHESLVVISFSYEKVLLKDRHQIKTLHVDNLPISKFRECFFASYPAVASGLIRELASAHSRTISEVESQLQSLRKKEAELERVSGAITTGDC